MTRSDVWCLCAVYKFIADNDEKIGSSIVYDRDMNYDFFAFKTLERAYLLKLDNKIAERPQHMIMRGECPIVSLAMNNGAQKFVNSFG